LNVTLAYADPLYWICALASNEWFSRWQDHACDAAELAVAPEPALTSCSSFVQCRCAGPVNLVVRLRHNS